MRLKQYRGRWAAVWREGGTTRRKSLETMDRGTAERRLADLIRLQKLERGGNTIMDVMTAYLDEKKEARSHGSMKTAWRALEPTFGHLRPDQITRDLCRSYALRRKRNGISDGTIIKDLGVLKAAVGWAGKAQGAVFEMPNTPPPKERYLTREEFDRLIEACAWPHLRVFVTLGIATGARAGALLELTWDRVEFDVGQNGQIRLGKGEGRRKGRSTVPMTKTARAALLEAKRAATTDYVIEWGGKPVVSVKKAFESACRRAGLENVTPHVLRHTAAVWMVQAGVPLHKVSQYLGHTKTAITERVYARFSPDFLMDAAKALE